MFRPVALRPTQPSLAYAGLLLHCLFYVPQVRNAIAQWRPFSDADSDTENQPNTVPIKGPSASEWPNIMVPISLTMRAGYLIWSLLEIFVNMDIALLSELNVDAAIAAFDPGHWSTPVEPPGDVVYGTHPSRPRPRLSDSPLP